MGKKKNARKKENTASDSGSNDPAPAKEVEMQEGEMSRTPNVLRM